MIPFFFGKLATVKLNFLLLLGGAGLLASLTAGCSGTAKAPTRDKNVKITVHKPQVHINNTAITSQTEVQDTATSSHQHQHHYMNTMARLEKLKDDQLQALSNKVAYSDHAVPRPTINPPTSPKPQGTAITETSQYTVEAGENLYAIAAKASIYQDGLLWPLIYKSNRDQIKDPEQIFPGQHLTISHKHSALEKEAARETARKSGIFIH